MFGPWPTACFSADKICQQTASKHQSGLTASAIKDELRSTAIRCNNTEREGGREGEREREREREINSIV